MTLVQTELKSMKIWKPSRLPAEYQEVEWIEYNGTQYIDTGVKPTNNTKVENKGYFINDYTQYGVGYAGQYQSLVLLAGNGCYRARCRSGSYSNSTVTSTVPLGTTPHEFIVSQGGGFYIDGTQIGTFTSYTYTESYNIYICGWNSQGSFIGNGTGRIYYFKIYEGGVLTRDFIPCYRKADTVIGLYDLVNNQFYTNQGTGTFTKGNDTDVPAEKEIKRVTIRPNVVRLPAEYQEVEYIQSSGTQYFTVGNSFKTSYKVVMDFQMTVTGGYYIPIGIHYSNSGSTNIKYGVNAYSSYFKVNAGGSTRTNTISEDTNRHTITINKSAVIVDGTNYTTNYVDYTFNQGIGLFCYNEIHLAQYNFNSSNKLYKLDIYDENGILLYDLVPCYRKADSVIGMYDLVNDVFYTNSGTGTFTKGADIPSQVEKQIRPAGGGGWTPGANTLAYYPLTSITTVYDQSGNSKTLTNDGSVTFGTYKGVDCAYFGGSNYLYTNNFYSNQNQFTVSGWMYYVNNGYQNSNIFRWGSNQGPWFDRSDSYKLKCSPGDTGSVSVTSDSQWHHYAFTYTGGSTGTQKFYFDGTLVGTNSSATPPAGTGISMGRAYDNATNYFKGGEAEIIVENVIWDDTMIANYYNQTKGNYGL